LHKNPSGDTVEFGSRGKWKVRLNFCTHCVKYNYVYEFMIIVEKALKSCCDVSLFHSGVMQMYAPKEQNDKGALKIIEAVWRCWL
jgi:hypothetical protein